MNAGDEPHSHFGKREVEQLSRPNVCVWGGGLGSPTPNTRGNVSPGKTHLSVYLVVKGAAQGIRGFSGGGLG